MTILKAVVYRGPRNIVVEEVAKPEPSEKEVLVKFKAGSICGTDMHLFRGEWTWMKSGRIMGHDACGIRTDTGERAVMIPVTYCGLCYYCLRGLQTLCENSEVKGFGIDGFFAEYTTLPPQNLLPTPSEMSDEEAAIVEPVALAIRTLDMIAPKVRDWVTVLGQGPIGLLMTQVAKLKGCRVIAVDLQDQRLKLSEKYGADICINAAQEDPVKRVKAITEKGSDAVIETAGRKQTVEQTPFFVRRAGKVALIGESKGYLDLERADEVLFFTCYISPLEYPTAVDLIAHKVVDVKNMITHRFKLVEFDKALKTADNPAEKAVKIIITA